MIDREQMLAAYERAWKHREAPGIRAELETCCTPDSTHVSPLSGVVHGVEGLVNLILDYPVMFPGARMRLTSPPDMHHDLAYFTWRLTSTTRIRMMGRDYGLALDGIDFVEFHETGRIRRITSFFGADRMVKPKRSRAETAASPVAIDDPSDVVIDLETAEPEPQRS